MFETTKRGELVRLPIGACAIIERPLPWQKMGLSYTTSGYGKKIPTRYMVRTINNKWRRVYCAVYSNSGTLYVMHGKARTIVDLPY